jgi:quercetin dioxygenase-like cupin family protein
MLRARLETAADAIIVRHYTRGADFPKTRLRLSREELLQPKFGCRVEWRRVSYNASFVFFLTLRGANMKAILPGVELLRGKRWHVSRVAALLFGLAFSMAAQAPKSGIVRQLSDVKFPAGEGPDCLQFFLENGDLNSGPTTAIMKAAPKCVIPPHYHTAEEQLIIVKGNVSTGMEGMPDTVLGPGGFAMMPSKAPHWFTCTAKEECLMFVTFDRAYDIVWIKPNK